MSKQYDLSFQNQVKLICILLGVQKTRISVEIRTGSPPVCASKNAVPKFLSVNNIVIAPAKTGRDKKVEML